MSAARVLVTAETIGWARIAGPNASADPPAVDFTREMLLVAGMGEQPCMGSLINIDTIFRDDERRIYAVVRERHRGAGCGCLKATRACCFTSAFL